MLKLRAETCLVHKLDHVAGGLRVGDDLVVIYLPDTDCPQLIPQFRACNYILRALHNDVREGETDYAEET
jgi:hypothetical protein